jgi:hypothetical protein
VVGRDALSIADMHYAGFPAAAERTLAARRFAMRPLR